MPNGTGTRGGQGGNNGGSGGTRTSPAGGYGTSNGNSTGGGGGGGPGGGTRGFGAGQGAAAGANIAGNGGNGGGNGFAGPALPTTARQGGAGFGASDGLYGASGAGGGGGGGAGGYGAVASTNGTLTVNLRGGSGGGGGSGGVNFGGGDGGSGGFGGGGGGGLSFGGAGLTVGAAATLQGGTGGGGGNGGNGVVSVDSGGSAGGGGAGGDGLDLTGTATRTVTNAGTISGGAGGAGGNGGSRGGMEGSDGSSGAGGDGGNGINVIGPAATTLTNSGTITGGIGGTSPFAGSAGPNGAGVWGANLTITNTGTISGGGSGTGQANAITFAGGANSLTPGSGTLNGNIAVDGTSTTLAVKASGATTLGNVITGSGSLTFGSTAASVITLTAANTYTGTTTVSFGTLIIRSDLGLGSTTSGTTVASGATLKVESTGLSISEPLTLNGTGVANGGALRGAGVFETGSIALGAASRINSDSGNLQITGAVTGTNRNLTVGGAGDVSISGAIQTGSATLTKDGTGTTTLSGANTYTGTTTISAGTLVIKGAGTLGSSAGGTTVASGATLQLAEPGLSIGDTLTLNGMGVANGGALRHICIGYSSNFVGSIVLGSASRINSQQSGTTANSLNINGSITGSGQNLTLGGTGYIDIRGAINTGTGALTVDGSSVSLSGVNTYTGVTTVTGGGLSLMNGNAIVDTGAVVVNAPGTLVLFDSETLGSIAGSGRIALGGFSPEKPSVTLTAGGNNSSTTFSGSLENGINGVVGSFVKTGTGTLTLSGANTYSGRTTVAAGTLVAKSATALGSSVERTDVNSGATLRIEGAGLTFNENIVIYGTGVGNGGALRNVGTGDPAGTNTVQNILLGSASRINSDAGLLQINGLITAPNYNLTLGGSGLIYAYDTIQIGSGSLTKGGTGIVALFGANTYTGVTAVASGFLDLLNGAAIADTGAVVVNALGTVRLFNSETVGSIAGSGNIVLANSTLTAGGNNSSTSQTGIIRDFDPANSSGGVVKTGTGTLTLSGANTYSQGTTISAGTLTLSNTSTTTAVASLGTGGVSIASGATLEVANPAGAAANFGLGNTISGAGAVVYGGPGTGVTNVTGANTYTGRTTITSGTVVAKTATALGASAERTDVNSGATLKIEGSGLTFNENLVLYGTGVGDGGALHNAGTGDPAGTNTVQNILLGSAARINSDAGLLQISGLITATNDNLTLGGSGLIYAYNTIQIGTGTLTKDGTGVVALYGANTYTGVTTVASGLLDLLNGAAIADTGAVVVNAPGELRLFSSETVGSIAGSGNIVLANATLTAGGNNSSTSYAGIIRDFVPADSTGGLVKTGTGTLTLSGANTYSQGTTIAGGTLKLRNLSQTTAVASLGTGAVSIASGAVLEVTSSDRVSGDFTIANQLTGLGSVKYTGATGSYTVVRNANTYEGGTLISSGIVEIGDDRALGTGLVAMTGGGIRAIDAPRRLANDFTLGGTIGLGFGTSIAGAITLSASTTITPCRNAGGSEWSGSLSLGGFALTLADTGPNSAGATWDSATLIISGSISGTGRIVQSSSGGLLLLGTNSYSGGTTIGAGKVKFDNGAALGTGSVTFTASGTSLEAAASVTLSNNVAIGANTVMIGADPGATLTLGGQLSGTGTLQASGGTLALSSAVSFSGAATVLSGATLALTGAGSLAASAVALSANSAFDISGVTTDATVKAIDGAGATSLVKLGAKRLNVAAAMDGTKVRYVSAVGQASSVVISVASANFSLGTASFLDWTNGEDTVRVNGSNGRNVISGSIKNDILDGGVGADTLKGSVGDDTYYVDDVGDQVIESVNTGIDTVRSTRSWTLGANLENLFLEGNALAGTGNELANIIAGNTLANIIEGGGGTDSLSGGLGEDLFVYHAAFGKDTIGDFTAGSASGRDRLQIDQTLFANFGSVRDATQDTAAGAVITYDAVNTITLTGVLKDDLVAANFSFV